MTAISSRLKVAGYNNIKEIADITQAMGLIVGIISPAKVVNRYNLWLKK
jgi:hypothetical protein